MKFQPARHAGPPHSNTAGVGAGVGLSRPANAAPSAPLNTSFDVNTSGEGGVSVSDAGATKALPIVEKLIGSCNTWTPMTPVVRAVWDMALMMKPRSVNTPPGTRDIPKATLT